MPLTRCELQNINSLDELYAQLGAQLSLPAHFGNNLDALWDVLSTDLPGPLEIIWRHPQTLGKQSQPVIELFQEAEQSRDDLSFLIVP